LKSERYIKPTRRLGPAPLALVLAGLVVSACGASRPPHVDVFPIPGSRVVSPGAQIVFRGVALDQIGNVKVTGSRTGVHTGRLIPDSDGHGGSFVPRAPFAPGETVEVRTKPHSSGTRVRPWRFTIATPAGAIPTPPLPSVTRVPGDVMTFHSRPDLSPATVEITKPTSDQAGDIFITPQQGPVQNGPMIVDPTGQLVWFQPLAPGQEAADFKVQTFHGKPVLTWWQGRSGAGVGIGEDVVEDPSYRQIAVVRAAGSLSADLHEFQLTRGGTALLTAYYPVYWDASGIGGPRRAIVLDSVVQEIDVATGLLLYQWDSLDHVPMRDTYEPRPKSSGQPIDYFHINSVQEDGGDDLIISARNTWAAYKIDRHTGRPLWILGGKRSTFRLGKGVKFAFQHDVRVRDADERTVSLFDDGAGPPVVHHQSRAVKVRLDPDRKTAELIKQDEHSPPLLASYEGNMQALPSGDWFLGWGQQPYFTQYDGHGQEVFEGRFVDAIEGYRAYRFPWSGSPQTHPAIAAVASGQSVTVYASWNGATRVKSWRALSGATSAQLRQVATAQKRGFETPIAVPAASYFAVQAVAADGTVLGTSPAVRAS
jgi:arylsulfotransferase ASST